jgi:uracil-DNA glycosylase family 4
MNCPHCNKTIIPVSGRSSSPIVLLGEAPTFEEIRVASNFVGDGGQILRAELSRAGIQYQDCRATTFWRHDPKVGKEFAKDCKAFMVELLLKELSTARACLIMGSDVTKFLTGKNVSSVNGTLVHPAIFPSCVEVVVAAFSPAVVLRMTVGDFRLALTRFANYTKEIRKEWRNGR